MYARMRGWFSLAIMVWTAPAFAQGVESITVSGDPVHLLQTGANDAAFGLDKPLLETPRAVTLVSDATIARYGVSGVNDLTAITPSAYTASYYGVEGAVSLRGTLAENYFRGFKRAENRGTYSTPLSDAAGIEILRGPPSPIYGAGKAGGLHGRFAEQNPILLFRGPGFRAGANVPSARTIDVVPTLLKAVNIAPAATVDGTPIADALR